MIKPIVICKNCLSQCRVYDIHVYDDESDPREGESSWVTVWGCMECGEVDSSNMLFVGFNNDAPL